MENSENAEDAENLEIEDGELDGAPPDHGAAEHPPA